MTQLEAWFCGILWGLLSRTQTDIGTIEVPAYGSDDPEARAELIVQLPSGKALRVTVTEFDTEASRHRKAQGE